MSKVQDLFKDENLLEKVAIAETREDAKKVCKEGGLEVSDADLDVIAGGLTTTQKVLIGVGAAAGTAALGVGTYYTGKHFGWWGKKPSPSIKDINEDKYGMYNIMPPNNLAGVVGEKMPQHDDIPNVQPDENGNN